MSEITKISLYDFAKQSLRGKEPKSVTIYGADRKTIISREEFNLNSDIIQSVNFTVSDSMITLPDLDLYRDTPVKTKYSKFPGTV